MTVQDAVSKIKSKDEPRQATDGGGHVRQIKWVTDAIPQFRFCRITFQVIGIVPKRNLATAFRAADIHGLSDSSGVEYEEQNLEKQNSSLID
ncbi:hypothetical protein POX_f07468 [Penicillium oxalicum]|uniref:hypothetical protein n=1 Tax=Penicillium oxalicum TaxID=69781 RepID=UPI0020B7E411|nr:hypothetical protein POX_f07468 [Penicillium oxalicum]KAI2787109.1 hypothetical protein POX_f07468 [Penicillium oxalicum]